MLTCTRGKCRHHQARRSSKHEMQPGMPLPALLQVQKPPRHQILNTENATRYAFACLAAKANTRVQTPKSSRMLSHLHSLTAATALLPVETPPRNQTCNNASNPISRQLLHARRNTTYQPDFQKSSAFFHLLGAIGTATPSRRTRENDRAWPGLLATHDYT